MCRLSCCLPRGGGHVEKRPVTASLASLLALQHPPSALPHKPTAGGPRGRSGTSTFAEKILGEGE